MDFKNYFINYCPKCGNFSRSDIEHICSFCGTELIDTSITVEDFVKSDATMDKYRDIIQEDYVMKSLDFDRETFERREAEEAKCPYLQGESKDEKNNPSCPVCGSTALSANKKGFGLGKAAVGGILTGGAIGLLGGFIGSRKVEITCLNCSHHWIVGKK